MRRFLCLATLLVGLLPAVADPALVVLSDSADKATLNLGGRNSLVVESGGIHVNSPHRAAIFVANSAVSVKEGGIRVVGGHMLLGEASCDPLPENAAAFANPYAALQFAGPKNTASSKTLFVRAGTTATLHPGIYRGGINIGRGSDITLEPGLYVMLDGQFFASESTVRGTGVTLFMGGQQPLQASFSNCTAELSAPTDGPLKGLVAIGLAQENAFSISGGSARLTGAVYLPRGRMITLMDTEVTVDRVVAFEFFQNTGGKVTITGRAAAE